MTENNTNQTPRKIEPYADCAPFIIGRLKAVLDVTKHKEYSSLYRTPHQRLAHANEIIQLIIDEYDAKKVNDEIDERLKRESLQESEALGDA